jgi:hypothetical protein
MACVNQGRNHEDGEQSPFFLPQRGHEHVVVFWMESNVIVGASCGEQTRFLMVEWQVNGQQNTVHGRPVTEAELRSYGAQL